MNDPILNPSPTRAKSVPRGGSKDSIKYLVGALSLMLMMDQTVSCSISYPTPVSFQNIPSVGSITVPRFSPAYFHFNGSLTVPTPTPDYFQSSFQNVHLEGSLMVPMFFPAYFHLEGYLMVPNFTPYISPMITILHLCDNALQSIACHASTLKCLEESDVWCVVRRVYEGIPYHKNLHFIFTFVSRILPFYYTTFLHFAVSTDNPKTDRKWYSWDDLLGDCPSFVTGIGASRALGGILYELAKAKARPRTSTASRPRAVTIS